jgi:hypothetical protein
MAKTKKAKVVYEKEGSHKLLDEGGALTLEVLVGTAALYVVRMALNEKETAAWQKGGAAYADKLAGEVVKDEPKLRKAGRTVPV